jgi:hypothetical protein
MDLLQIDYIRACYISSDGCQVYCDHISTDFSAFALSASVSELTSNMWQVAKPEFEKAVRKVTQDTEFKVKGILDDRCMTVSEAFELTYAKASSQCAVNMLRNKPALDRCKVTVPGIQVQNKTAVVTLVSKSASAGGTKRGPGQNKGTAAEVSNHSNSTSAIDLLACYYVTKPASYIHLHYSEYQCTSYMWPGAGRIEHFAQGAEGRHQLHPIPGSVAGSILHLRRVPRPHQSSAGPLHPRDIYKQEGGARSCKSGDAEGQPGCH